MKKSLLLAFILCVLCAAFLFSLGKKDGDDAPVLNEEWVLCVTAFDYALSPERRITGDVLTRSLVDNLDLVSYRLRISPEYAYYESYAWQQQMSAAAQALSAKQNERSAQVYRGDPRWRYRRNLKRLDAEIKKLQETYDKTVAEKPLIHKEPSFQLSQANAGGTYPPPPQEGGERRFCREQNADAFLAGEIREYHGRYYINLRLFALYTNSYIYGDDIIFSLEDLDGAVEEITARLTAALAGTKPSAVAVVAHPEESQILINGNFAGRGTADPRDRPPGTVIIAVTADGFESQAIDTELTPGELTELDVTLTPLHYADVRIGTSDGGPAFVYYGSMFMGEAPLTLHLPVSQLHYLTVENWKGEMGKGVFSSPPASGEAYDLSFKLKKPPSGNRRVNKARGQYYWAWAGTWVTGIAAWATYGVFASQSEAYQVNMNPKLYDSAMQMYYISTGALVAVGVAVVYEIFQMGRYLYTATSNVTPVVKQRKQKQ